MPEGDAIHRAARRLQVARRRTRRGRDAASAGPGQAAPGAARRPPARGSRGGRQEPAAPLRGRPRPPQPSAHARALAGPSRGTAARAGVPGSSCAEPSAKPSSGTAPCSSCTGAGRAGSGRTSSPIPPDFDAMLARFRLADQGRAVGEALLDQRLVAGIGNLWKAEALWAARVSPWRKLADVSDRELLEVLRRRGAPDAQLARARQGPRARRVPSRRPPVLRAAATTIRSRGQGDDNRIAYWCPECQRGAAPPGS